MASPALAVTNSPIVAAYRARTPGSAKLSAEAQAVLPSGVTHDSRFIEPYGLYVERASGSHKWDVDGNEYVDYYGGHGALLLGHNHPRVTAAVHAAVDRGSHFGANHPLEVRWAQLVQRLVPSAERVRFTSSGTEASLMAVRLARAFTGRPRIVRFRSHFHGWHDHMSSGWASHFDGTPTIGVLRDIAENAHLVDTGDVAGLTAALAPGNVAAVLIEPTGASFGMVPATPEFVHRMAELAQRHGALVIFDEVVTGFRVAPGGAQAELGIRPDLTTLAKMLAGGLPGGAVAGRKDVMDGLDFAAARAKGREKIGHPGTFNANPISAAAGIAALEVVGGSDACRRANEFGARLRESFNDEIEHTGVPWAAYGTYSGLHIFMNGRRAGTRPHDFDPTALSYVELKTKPAAIVQKLRLAMNLGGVDLNGWPGALASAAHDDGDLDRTVRAFREALILLRREGEI
ncbi:MAG: aminotransferase class III-fold pyridoxal phosphate-dependent enzyme [Proteobacteria bacterium]|nr:aminotransferase class III-fold pyridoxal phosphate-dependent enzyme [Pseudomonadota bacterium]